MTLLEMVKLYGEVCAEAPIGPHFPLPGRDPRKVYDEIEAGVKLMVQERQVMLDLLDRFEIVVDWTTMEKGYVTVRADKRLADIEGKPFVCGEDGRWCHGTCKRHGRCMYVSWEE